MPLYVYTALSPNGAMTRGEDAAATREELAQALAGRVVLTPCGSPILGLLYYPCE